MRQTDKKQLPLAPLWPDHQLSQELRVISKILDETPQISSLVLQDLCDTVSPKQGASGMSGEQVLRCAVLKKICQCSYQQLAFHLVDSISFRSFCRLPYGAAPARSTLQENISRIRSSTWQTINQQLVSWAHKNGLENGRKVRIDATVVESDIHYPLDSRLLYDSVRVTTRMLEHIAEREKICFHNHCRRAKRRLTNIRNSRGLKRKKYYADLIRVTRKTRSYAKQVIVGSRGKRDPILQASIDQLKHWASLMDQVIEQSYRRVILGEVVPVDEKIVSIFQEHTDIICKGGRDTLFGHKIFLTCGKSSLMLDCLLTRGNPADQSLAGRMLRRQQKLFDRYPRQASFDGGFATPDNLKWAKKQGVQDVVFAKKSRSEDREYGSLQLGLPTAATFSGRHRGLYLHPETCLWVTSLSVERLGPLPTLCPRLHR